MSWNWIDYDNTYSLTNTNCITISYRFTNTNSDCNINPASNNFAYANGNRDFFAKSISFCISDPNGDCNPNCITKPITFCFTDTNTCINSDSNFGSTPICACFSYSDSANTATKCIANPYSNTTSDRIFTDTISIANSI